MPAPLEGIRVLDLSTVLMGPAAGQQLAEMGADVIKIEPPGGDPTRRIGPGAHDAMGSNFLNMNRGKRSLVLDLKKADDLAILRRWIRHADVLIHNLRPASAGRLGLDAPSLSALNERLILCALTGFGSGGPYAGRAAYDDLIQGLAGLAGLAEQTTGEPAYVPTPIADRVTSLYAVISILGALQLRSRTGRGQAVEVPMFESVAHLVLSDHLFGESFVPARGGPGYNRILSRYRRPCRTSDGWICVLIYTDRHWRRFFELAGHPAMADDPRFASMRDRNDHIDELYAFVGDRLASAPTEHWMKLLSAADIPVGPLHSLGSLIDDPHLAAVDFFDAIEHPTEGPLRSPRNPVRNNFAEAGPLRPAPNLGEHSAELMRELQALDACYHRGHDDAPSPRAPFER